MTELSWDEAIGQFLGSTLGPSGSGSGCGASSGHGAAPVCEGAPSAAAVRQRLADSDAALNEAVWLLRRMERRRDRELRAARAAGRAEVTAALCRDLRAKLAGRWRTACGPRSRADAGRQALARRADGLSAALWAMTAGGGTSAADRWTTPSRRAPSPPSSRI